MPDLPAPGFDRPTTTPVPDELFDLWLPHLSEAELKVLLYICRRTLGFKKDADAISLSQLAEGIVRRDGRRLDSGAGVSEKSCRRGIAGLLEKGLITQTKTKLPDGGDGTTIYSLCWRGGQNDHRGLDNLSEARWSEGTPQQTDVTTNKNGSDIDPELSAAIRTWAYQHKVRTTELQIAAAAVLAGTLARWQVVSAGAPDWAAVQRALGEET